MGHNVELGGEFLLEPNDHFNNLSVNLSLSVVQVPTNMYNKGESTACTLHAVLFHYCRLVNREERTKWGGRKVSSEREKWWWRGVGIDTGAVIKRNRPLKQTENTSVCVGGGRCWSYVSCWVASCFITERVTPPCVSPGLLLFAHNRLPIILSSQHKGRLVQQEEGRGEFIHRHCISFRGSIRD